MPAPDLIADLIALPEPALIDRLCALDSAERETLRRPARQALDEYHRHLYGEASHRPRPSDGDRLRLILLATAPAADLSWPQTKRSDTAGADADADAQWRIVHSRGRRFLDALARATVRWMSEVTSHSPIFEEIRAHERAGSITLAVDDTYVLAMISGLTGQFQNEQSKADLLRADPDLVDRAFWRIFEVEGNREVSLTNVDRFLGPETQSWQEAVLELAADGTIDRQRVLDATLAALARAFPQYRAGWFSRLHEALRPTVDEAASRQAAYAGLLRSPLGPTVALALGALTTLDNAGRLDDTLTNAGLAAAVHVPARTTATRAVRLAGRIMRRNTAAGLDILAAALRHPHADVQSAALAELRRHGSPSARAEVERHLDQLAPSTAAAARQWLGPTDAPPAPENTASDPVRPAPTPAAVVAPPSPVRAAEPHPVVPAQIVPEQIVPITEPAELAEALAVLLAHPDDAELGERCLGAAARLGADPARYGPLTKRAHRLHRDSLAVNMHGHPLGVTALVLACAGERQRGQWRSTRYDAIIAGRFAEVTGLLLAGGRRQLAAEPTHHGGWVDPDVLIDRLSATPDPMPLDTVAALLRLGPHTTATATLAARADHLPQRLRRPLTYALGGPPPTEPVTDDHPLWIAAARARAPYDDDPWLRGLPTGPDRPALDVGGAGQAPRWTVEVAPPRYDGQLARTWGLEAKPTSTPPGETDTADPLRPTVSLAQLHASAWTPGPYQPILHPHPGWASLIWPGNIDPMLTLGLEELWDTVHGIARTDAVPALALLAGTAAAPPTLGSDLLAAGFASAFLDVRTAAVDAAAVLLPGRIATAELAAAMVRFAPAVPVNRWTSALTDLSTAGRGDQVLALLTALLPHLDRGTRGLHGLVELLRDEHLRAAVPVTDPPLRAWLTALAKGNSKTAKAAATLTTR
ncbi:hypothetical protein BDK92_2015 [Micromonospora pisi]|uniref:DUF6493 domain-containing protein n=1 Tax=Micromonospora pisi TaxID=589240 RepID=A0A495JFQ6_9ACTN|nr:DUF6493 family protein [Micromonospora pisi]RKR87723.1 hypothetical protein BDK92_2015 [Micromonospora pisi]